MLVKTSWLFIFMILCSVNSECRYIQISYNLNKKNLCYVSAPTLSLLIFMFFAYRYMSQKLPVRFRKISLDNFGKLPEKIKLSVSETFPDINNMPAYIKDLFLHYDVNDNDTAMLLYFSLLPKDIQRIINKLLLKDRFDNQYTEQVIVYPMNNGNTPEYLFYPCNLGNNVLVKQTTVGFTNPSDLAPEKGQPCFFDTQFWITREFGMRISQDTTVTNHSIYFNTQKLALFTPAGVPQYGNYGNMPKNPISQTFIVDGINKQNTAIVGINNVQDNVSAIYIINVTMHSETFNEAVQPVILLENGLLNTIMIHPSKNIIAYANIKTNKDNMQQNEIHIINNAYFYTKEAENAVPMDYFTLIDFGIKKLTFFGGGTYIFLTLMGQLGMVWQGYNEKKEIVLQYALKDIVNASGEKIQRNYIDFTTDTKRQKESGFMP
ncbi:MAG TPA: hypothetical protein VL201_03675, partial [Patescibacteria group bacterium]|nr:hypothetical protein [Patescibacteria group bacterium]